MEKPEQDKRQWLYHTDNEPTMFDGKSDDIAALKAAGWVETPWEVKKNKAKETDGPAKDPETNSAKPDRKALLEEARALEIEFNKNIKTDALIELINTAKANKPDEE